MPLTTYENLPQKILCIDIGLDNLTDFVRWTRANTNIFPMDIQAGRSMAKENFFLQIEKPDRRMVFIKKKKIVFLIMADVEIQYQMLEAILEVIIEEFFKSYGAIIDNFFSGMTNIFEGFKTTILRNIDVAQKERVKWIQSRCSICNTNYYICVRKSLITNAKSFPVSLVFKHGGHGLLIYLDAKFRTRGSEFVEITG
ncbi:MAG: hypothetical protein DRO88_07955 [Promethearchaeia archaeon]|nr:MAG: hypothetical protein DRO88_07955 [Candidatus Lokiarchaeia archaeon]